MKSKIGNLAVVGLAVLTVAVWFIFPPVNDGREGFARVYAGEVIGSVNIVLMACGLVLAARPKWAEPYFGGLDKMYVAHRRIAKVVLFSICAHVLTVPISGYWILGNYLAVAAFSGILSIGLVSLALRIPFLNKVSGGNYEAWKSLKKTTGIFFVIGFVHALTIKAPLNAFIAINYVQVFVVIGAAAYLYTELFGGLFKKYRPYTVEAVSHPSPSTTEVTLRPTKDPIRRHRAGQFLFVRFPGSRTLDESHPFTISSAPREDVLRVTVKASGDFTRALFNDLKPGMDATVEGAYGLFDYMTGGPRQVWIAGGIGLTPFLSFIRDMDGRLDRDVDFYYTVRHREDALFLDEIEAAAQRNPRLKAHLRVSSVDGPLTFEEVSRNLNGRPGECHVYLCGPLAMTRAFEKKFREAGVPAGHIHFEEFNFR